MLVPDDVRHAIDKLKSAREGDLGVDQAVFCGERAIPALRQVLFEHEPSGLYHVRRRAVEALAALHAYDALLDFLRAPREATDPVELMGDEGVVNAAALALAKVQEEHVFHLLLSVAKSRHLIGVTAAIGSFQKQESIPYLVDALGADDCRLAAETALKRFGRLAESALMEAAICGVPSDDRESVSSIRRRRSALALLADIPPPPESWPTLRQLISDNDGRIVLLTCNICLAIGPIEDQKHALHRLIGLLPDADWMLAQDIEQCLVVHLDAASDVITAAIQERMHLPK